MWLAHARKRIQKKEHHLDADDKKGILIFSLKQVVWLVIGFAVGYFVPFWVKASATAVDILLWLIESPAHINVNRLEVMPVAQTYNGLTIAKQDS